MQKNWCFWTVVLEKTLESPLDCKDIQPVHLKGNQSWIFIGRTDAPAETPILWPPDVKNWSLKKTWMLGKIEGRRRRGWQRMRWLDDVSDSKDMSMSKFQEIVKDREAWHAAVHGVAKSQTQLSDWTTKKCVKCQVLVNMLQRKGILGKLKHTKLATKGELEKQYNYQYQWRWPFRHDY